MSKIATISHGHPSDPAWQFTPTGSPAQSLPGFRTQLGKAAFDIVLSAFGVLALLLTAALLVIVNPFLNPGPLFYRQTRLGLERVPFTIWKFRTMASDGTGEPRRVSDRLEIHRITPLGRILRKYRIDELPNFINVMRGEMSVIGPRPECSAHAIYYLASVENYRHRFSVKPGITGLAQVECGYAEGIADTTEKARLDRHYVENRSAQMDLSIALRTVAVVLTGSGAR